MTKKAIIFDMDGTLSNTAIATLAAYHMAAEKLPIPKVTIQQIENAMGLGGLEFHENVLPGTDIEILKKVEQFVDIQEDKNITELGKSILFDGVYEMLEKLFSEGYQLHIASTGNESHVMTTLNATDIKKFFTSINHSEPQKKDMVRKIITTYGNPDEPGNWIMVGDMFKDSEAAHANNITAVGAAFGYLSEEDYSLFDVILDTPQDIFR